jgi:predicted ester cyclase
VLLDVEKLLRLWTDPLPRDDDEAVDAFRRMYTDPVTVNGTPQDAADMVARARVMQAALAEPEREVLAVVESSDAVAVAFRLAGRHVGPLDTPAGRLPASGARIDLRVIDVLSIAEGRISAIWMVGDWLGALAPTGMVQVQTSPVSAGPTGAT